MVAKTSNLRHNATMLKYKIKVLKEDGTIVELEIAATSHSRARWLAGAHGTVLPKRYRIIQSGN